MSSTIDMRASVLIIGNSDGIGLAVTRRLLERGHVVTGISRSPSVIVDEPRYTHHVADVRSAEYDDIVRGVCSASADESSAAGLPALDVCIYCAGIGEELDLDQLVADAAVFEVNLMGLVRTVALVMPTFLAAGRGHFIGLSSQGDRFLNVDAPSYSASKAGVSSYLEALALAVRGRGVHVTNVRFGFVATKMARSAMRPFEISADRAARCLERCLERRPVRYTYPRRMAVVLAFANAINRVRTWLA